MPRLWATLTIAGLAVGLTAVPAQAHVEVAPGSVTGGGFSVVAFRVPNERDDASTTRLRVILPEDEPLGSVQTTPMPGWRLSTTTRELDDPIRMFGAEIDSVVSELTWTATGSGLRPGEFADFEVSLGQLPESGELVFSAIQTYSSGETVRWNEVSQDATIEPEHPAPVLRVTGADDDQSVTSAQTSSETSAAAPTAGDTGTPAADDDGPGPWLPTALAAAALAVALLAAGLAWRRGRR